MRLMGKSREQLAVEQRQILADKIRAERNARIQNMRWRIERYNDELALGLEPTEPVEPILQYIQALRDITKQEGFPFQVEWPKEP